MTTSLNTEALDALPTLATYEDIANELAPEGQTGSPSSGRLAVARAWDKLVMITSLCTPEECDELIAEAASAFEEKHGERLCDKSLQTLNRKDLLNVVSHAIEEYKEIILGTRTLSHDEVAFLTEHKDVPAAIVQSPKFQHYLLTFWDEAKTKPQGWLLFDRFRAELRNPWNKKRRELTKSGKYTGQF